MKISATQLSTLLDPEAGCGRKWWFSYKRKVPVFKRNYFGVGSVLHGCCERYLLGNDDPFTEGWDIDPDTKQRIAPSHAGLVKKLVEKGIEAGYLERRPGQLVEQWFSLPVEGVTLVGKKDVESPARIEDHKTSKNIRYLKSKEKLRKDLQLLIYAYELLCKSRKRGELDPRIITLAHNQFITDPGEPEVRRREAEVTPEEVDGFWNNVVRPGVRKIIELSTVEDPWTIPDPDKRACQAYGGCPFLTMCSGSEDILTYSARIANMLSQPTRPEPTQLITTYTQPMATVADFMKARTQGIPPASTAPSVNPPLTAAPAVVPVVQAAAPPWAVPQCSLCASSSTPGFKPGAGTPCRICQSISKVSLADYQWKIESDGKATWWKKGEKVAETAAPAPIEDKGSKAAYTADALYAKLKACASVDAVVEVLQEAESALGAGSVDLKTFAQVADARMEALEAEVEPPPSAAELAKPSAKPVLVNVAVGDKIVQMPAAEAAKHQGKMLTEGVAVVSQKALETYGKEAIAAMNGGNTEVVAVEPPKRKRGRPAKAAAALPVDTTGQQDENGDDVMQVVGFVLLIRTTQIGGTSFPGMEMQFAEEFLSQIPGYWSNDNVWERRQNLRKAFMEDPSMREGLNGRILIQAVADPDVDNLMSTLLGCKPALVLRGTV